MSPSQSMSASRKRKIDKFSSRSQSFLEDPKELKGVQITESNILKKKKKSKREHFHSNELVSKKISPEQAILGINQENVKVKTEKNDSLNTNWDEMDILPSPKKKRKTDSTIELGPVHIEDPSKENRRAHKKKKKLKTKREVLSDCDDVKIEDKKPVLSEITDETQAPNASFDALLELNDEAKFDLDFVFKELLKADCFKPDFKPAPLHEIVNRASKPTVEQRALIVRKEIDVKYGKFNKMEDKQIKENWKYFIKTNDLPNEPKYFFSLNKKHVSLYTKRNFLYYIARNMPERTPYAVFKRFKRLMRETKQGRYTESEDKYILQVIRNTEIRYSVTQIARHLNREPLSVEKRILKLKEQHKRKIKWRGKNAQTFIQALLKVTKTKDVQNLKSMDFTPKHWKKLSSKLDNVPVRILRRVWLEKLYPALFIPEERCDLGAIKKKLVRMFCKNQEHDWRNVDWTFYASKFEGMTYLRLYTLMKQLVQTCVPKKYRNNLKKCLKVLVDTKIPLNWHVLHKLKYDPAP